MSWSITEDLEAFAGTAGPFLRRDPALHTVQLTVIERLRADPRAAAEEPRPLFGCWRSADGVAATFMHTARYPLGLTTVPAEAVDLLARLLAERGRHLPAVDADPTTAWRFAAAWEAETGATSRIQREQRLHRLVELAWPSPMPPGRSRVARAPDRELLIAWNEAFARDIGGQSHGVATSVDDRLGYGGYTLWEIDGVPVSLAGSNRRVAGMVRIAPVYTPPDLRGRGYGGAATAAASEAALRDGATEVVLYTDLANPTSNALYRRLGYRPIFDQVVIDFLPREAP